MRIFPALLALWLVTELIIPAHAAITVVAHYRMGEFDPGAQPGQVAAAETQNSAGGAPLTRVGAPVYAGEGRPLGLSALSIDFNGSSDRYAGPVVAAGTNQFGIEAWVKSRGSTVGNASLAYNGNTGNSGWGLFRFGDRWGFLFGGVQLGSGTPAVTTNWTHLALVRDSGVMTFYVNGEPAATSNATPGLPAGNLLVGGNPLIATEFFDGLIDEVRIFTFAPGAFRVNDLNLFGIVEARPVPSATNWGLALLLVAIGLVGAFTLGRERRY